MFRAGHATALMARSISIPAPSAELPSTLPVGEQGRHPVVASAAYAAERTLRPVVGAPSRVAMAAARSWKNKRHTKMIVQPLRLVANGDAWPQRQTPIYSRVGKAADVIVMSGDQADRAQRQTEVFSCLRQRRKHSATRLPRPATDDSRATTDQACEFVARRRHRARRSRTADSDQCRRAGSDRDLPRPYPSRAAGLVHNDARLGQELNSPELPLDRMYHRVVQ